MAARDERALGSLGAIRAGYVASSAMLPNPRAEGVLALRATDIGSGGRVDWNSLLHVSPPRGWDRYTVSSGDLLVPLRSNRVAAITLSDVPPNVIAVGHWGIISVDAELVTPEFLLWYLNHSATRREMDTLAQGSKLRFMSMKNLRELAIPVPPLELQHRIVRADQLHGRVRELETELATIRSEMVERATLGALQHDHSQPER